jgi:glycine dehydrogenase subunit 1
VTDVELWSSHAAEHSNDLAGVIIPVTNTLGACEPWEALAEVGRRHGALVIAVANPMAFSVLRGPGAWGADVCVGEAQPLGLPLSWGGPYCGFMTAKAEHVRRMPGRIVGCSVDSRGQRAFTLTLQTREQHIRREKATSNICTNQGLMALQVCIYLAMVGREGFRRIGLANLERAALLRQMLLEVDGVEPVTGDDFFNEFTVKLPMPAKAALEHLRHGGILGGISFIQPNWLTICVTETKAEPHLLAYVQQVRAAIVGSRPVLVR